MKALKLNFILLGTEKSFDKGEYHEKIKKEERRPYG
jgi:hypothetical protein